MGFINSLILEGKIVKRNETVIALEISRILRSGAEEKGYVTVYAPKNYDKVLESKGHIGREIRVVGRLQQLQYTEDDKIHSKVVVIAEHIEFRPEVKTEETA